MMQRRLKIVWIAITAIATFASLSPGADPPTQPSKEQGPAPAPQPREVLKPAPNELLDKVQNQLHEIRSMEGNFDETIYLKGIDFTKKVSGRFAAKEPNRIIWVVETPPRNAIRVQGEELRIWDPGANAPRVKNLANNPTFRAVAQQSNDWASGNFKALSESYEVYVLKDEPLSLRFIPKPGTGLAKIFASVDATLTADRSSVARIQYRHPDGDYATVTFRDCQVNQPIKPSTWEFKP